MHVKPGRLDNLVLDTVDPDGISPFWIAVLGMEVVDRVNDGQYVELAVPAGGSTSLMLQRVPEDKIGKNRMHFDVEVEDLDEATAEIERLGGRWRDGQTLELDGYTWRNMADPQGNEFCIFPADADA